MRCVVKKKKTDASKKNAHLGGRDTLCRKIGHYDLFLKKVVFEDIRAKQVKIMFFDTRFTCLSTSTFAAASERALKS